MHTHIHTGPAHARVPRARRARGYTHPHTRSQMHTHAHSNTNTHTIQKHTRTRHTPGKSFTDLEGLTDWLVGAKELARRQIHRDMKVVDTHTHIKTHSHTYTQTHTRTPHTSPSLGAQGVAVRAGLLSPLQCDAKTHHPGRSYDGHITPLIITNSI